MFLKRILFLSLLISALFSLAGCSQPTIETMSQTHGGLTVELSFDPNPPAMMTSVEMTLVLKDSSGQPVDGAQVFYDLTMPAMKMPPNQPQAVGQGNGSYQTEATFTMGGQWQADVTVTVNGETVNFIFDFNVD
jgi:hypothetical protein